MNSRIVLGIVLLLCAGAAEAKKSVRPDQITQLQREGKIAPFDTLNAAALASHPGGTVRSTKLVASGGRYIYKVRVDDAVHQRWNLRIDAAGAKVLSDKKATPPPAAVPPPAN